MEACGFKHTFYLSQYLLDERASDYPERRKLVQAAQNKLVMVKERNTYHLPAWVEPPAEHTAGFTAQEP